VRPPEFETNLREDDRVYNSSINDGHGRIEQKKSTIALPWNGALAIG
jgi:hypothetical protein